MPNRTPMGGAGCAEQIEVEVRDREVVFKDGFAEINWIFPKPLYLYL